MRQYILFVDTLFLKFHFYSTCFLFLIFYLYTSPLCATFVPDNMSRAVASVSYLYKYSYYAMHPMRILPYMKWETNIYLCLIFVILVTASAVNLPCRYFSLKMTPPEHAQEISSYRIFLLFLISYILYFNSWLDFICLVRQQVENTAEIRWSFRFLFLLFFMAWHGMAWHSINKILHLQLFKYDDRIGISVELIELWFSKYLRL